MNTSIRQMLCHFRRLTVLLWAVGVCSIGCGADVHPVPPPKAPLLFMAVLRVGTDGHRFAVGEIGSQGKPDFLGWYKKGGYVRDQKIVEYDQKTDLLFLQDDAGNVSKLPLMKDAVTGGTMAPLSRENGKAFLRNLVENITKKAVNLPAEAKLNFNVDVGKLTPAHRAGIEEATAQARKEGKLFVLYQREDGKVIEHYGAPMPRSGFAPYIVANLTEDDWTQFQWELAISSIQSAEDRRESQRLQKSEKQTSK